MTTRLSLITPSGRLTLGNLLGALRPMAAAADSDAFYGLSDLHALTMPHEPSVLRTRTEEMALLLLASGLEPATLFIQSHVPAHRSLGYLLECVAHTGELGRMIQFKEKSRRSGASVRASLFTYPVLMAADILLYGAAEVPVGDDQRQHVELARDIAIRFNTTYGRVFTVPQAVHPVAGARVMDLADPTRKMSKSSGDAHPGSIFLLDEPDVVRRKVARAVTDSTGDVSRDPERPGVTNLIDILEACGGSAAGLSGYGALKAAVTDAVVAELEPLQKRYRELAADRAYVTEVYAAGAARCREVTAPVLAAAEAAIGLA
ncbi:tryptophan--tRNA ligase [Nocardioides sp. CCNWLW239]|uniref:tryptophan--tRNA ligase n=1 Tax=Nocardioides sp. CCNWLW239 TaxID=3128902 RepID=UPI00301B0DC0